MYILLGLSHFAHLHPTSQGTTVHQAITRYWIRPRNRSPSATDLSPSFVHKQWDSTSGSPAPAWTEIDTNMVDWAVITLQKAVRHIVHYARKPVNAAIISAQQDSKNNNTDRDSGTRYGRLGHRHDGERPFFSRLRHFIHLVGSQRHPPAIPGICGRTQHRLSLTGLPNPPERAPNESTMKPYTDLKYNLFECRPIPCAAAIHFPCLSPS